MVALEELKLLQTIIARLEDNEYKTRGWLFALITALSVARYSKNLALSPKHFASIGIGLILAFMIVEVIHRIPKRFEKAPDTMAPVFRQGNAQNT